MYGLSSAIRIFDIPFFPDFPVFLIICIFLFKKKKIGSKGKNIRTTMICTIFWRLEISAPFSNLFHPEKSTEISNWAKNCSIFPFNSLFHEHHFHIFQSSVMWNYRIFEVNSQFYLTLSMISVWARWKETLKRLICTPVVIIRLNMHFVVTLKVKEFTDAKVVHFCINFFIIITETEMFREVFNLDRGKWFDKIFSHRIVYRSSVFLKNANIHCLFYKLKKEW